VIGQGKYDDIVTELRERLGAQGIVLLVFNGNRGNGVSQQIVVRPSEANGVADAIADILADVAADMRQAIKDVIAPKHQA
jgi:hypothetical protein